MEKVRYWANSGPLLALPWRFSDVSRLVNHRAVLYRPNVEDNVVNSKKYSIM